MVNNNITKRFDYKSLLVHPKYNIISKLNKIHGFNEFSLRVYLRVNSPKIEDGGKYNYKE